MTINAMTDGLYLIDLDLPRTGFRRFISSWLLARNGGTILVDPGPRAVHPFLVDALQKLGINHIDRILLTHIHIDHAGGAGLLLAKYPMAKLICSPMAFRFLIDPSRLWEQSRKVLGDLAEAYGSIEPVPETALDFSPTVTAGDLRIACIETPGHAPHHVSYRIDDLFFVGEAAGTFTVLDGGEHYLRPATPPVFDLEIFSASLRKAQSAALGARLLCFAHYGNCSAMDWNWMEPLHQMERWLEIIRQERLHGLQNMESRIFDRLLAEDPVMERFQRLPEDIQARERYFTGNSIRGMLHYLSDQEPA